MNKKLIIFLLLFIVIFFNFTNQVFANGNQAESGSTPGSVNLNNPLTGNTTSTPIPVLIGKIINAALGIVGSLALVMFIYGGFVWMLAAGNNERVQKGKDILIWAAIGLVVIFASYAAVSFIFTAIKT
jgi:hypothetical protein